MATVLVVICWEFIVSLATVVPATPVRQVMLVAVDVAMSIMTSGSIRLRCVIPVTRTAELTLDRAVDHVVLSCRFFIGSVVCLPSVTTQLAVVVVWTAAVLVTAVAPAVMVADAAHVAVAKKCIMVRWNRIRI